MKCQKKLWKNDKITTSQNPKWSLQICPNKIPKPKGTRHTEHDKDKQKILPSEKLESENLSFNFFRPPLFKYNEMHIVLELVSSGPLPRPCSLCLSLPPCVFIFLWPGSCCFLCVLHLINLQQIHLGGGGTWFNVMNRSLNINSIFFLKTKYFGKIKNKAQFAAHSVTQ